MLINSLRARPLARPHKPSFAQGRWAEQEDYLHNLLSDICGAELHRNRVSLTVQCRPHDKPFELLDDTIVIDPDLFQRLNKREEFAFVLAQQAAFRLTGASSSGLQSAADRLAIEMMVDAGLNPRGAQSALQKVEQAYSAQNSGFGLAKAANTRAFDTPLPRPRWSS